MTNERLGTSLVQANVDLLCRPASLFHMTDLISDEAHALQAALSAVPGKSAVQNDIWRDAQATPVDLFGALHHTSFHRSDAQLDRFRISMTLPVLAADHAPDFAGLALSCAEGRPKRPQLAPLQCAHWSALPCPLPERPDAPSLLFASHQRSIRIAPATPCPDVWLCASSADAARPPPRTWEDLAPQPAPAHRRFGLGQALGGSSADAIEVAPSEAINVRANMQARAALQALQGVSSSLFGVHRGTLTMTAVAETLRMSVRLDALATAFGLNGRLALAQCIRAFLAAQQAFVLGLRADTVGGLLAATAELQECARAMGALFLCDDDALWLGAVDDPDVRAWPVLAALPGSDGAFLDRLYDQLVLGQVCSPPTTTLCMWLFVAISDPLLAQLSRVVFLGDALDDDVPRCLAQHPGWADAVRETTALLHLIEDITPALYQLCTTTWTPLAIETNAAAIQTALDRHAANLAVCTEGVRAFKQSRLQALADAIIALQENRPTVVTSRAGALDEALRKKQLVKMQQRLQRQLLDEQVAANAAHRADLLAKQHAHDAAVAQAAADRDESRLETDKERLVAVYTELIDAAEHKFRVQKWRQARLRRKEVFSLQYSALMESDAATWARGKRPVQQLTTGSVVSVPRGTPPPEEAAQQEGAGRTAIRVLQAPGGARSVDEASSETASVRVLREPGGGGAEAAKAIYGDGDGLPASAVIRVLPEPGGGGVNAADAIYSRDAPLDEPPTSVRVTQAPGGNGDTAASAIYDGPATTDASIATVRVLQVPGGGGHQVHTLLYGANADADDVPRPQVRVSQEPGGSGADVWHMLYDAGTSEVPSSRPSVRVLSTAPGGASDGVAAAMAPSSDAADVPRPHVRVRQAPGGDSNAVADALYAQFEALVVSRPGIKILQPAAGGKDSVSRLLHGGAVPTKALSPAAPRSSRQWLRWKLAQSSAAQAYASTELLPRTTEPLAMAEMAAMYRELLGHESNEYAPIDALVVASLDAPVRGVRALVGAVALHALREESQLVAHLTTLHDTMLLSGGLWVDVFVKAVVGGLGDARVQWGAPGLLNDAVASAMVEASYSPPVAGHYGYQASQSLATSASPSTTRTSRVRVVLASHLLPPSVDSVVAELQPHYAVPRALGMVLSPAAMASYAQIHKFGFQLKATLLQLQHGRAQLRWLRRDVALADSDRRRVDRYLHCQHHVAASLQAYAFQVIAQEWQHFRVAVDEAQDTIALAQRHDRYLTAILTRCFLTPAFAEVQRALQRCLQRIATASAQLALSSKASNEKVHDALAFLVAEATGQNADVLALCDALRLQRDRDGHAAAFVEELLLMLNLNEYYG
ncbi:hypothetical protein ACHHYP_10584 [Achlya hypogyna]|uniref:Gamma tubulin complex component C-terminal domain-containing protein n=1 Tax=Achlya hypogyna TaxID=1202772 RepID=A0A1V9YKZ7_ACHHY|nr:hypothetical protein ACHHYP_10584 [Achlya hypogyna]